MEQKYAVALAVALPLALIHAQACAQPSWKGTKEGIADYQGNQFSTLYPFPTASVPVTYQGTMTLASGIYVPLTSTNVTMASGSAALPTTFDVLTVANTGASGMVACWFGGAASGGCEPIAAGSKDSVNLNGGSAPTFFSASGTTAAFRRGN